MEGNDTELRPQAQPGPQPLSQAAREPENLIDMRDIDEIKLTASGMSGWLKFLGIFSIIYGALIALSIIGIIVAWLPIWMGVLMIQAANRAEYAEATGDIRHIGQMLQKLKTLFIVCSILIILSLLMAIGAIVFFISLWPSLEHLMHNMPGV